MQVEHNDASSTVVQTISADHAEVSHFSEAILHPKQQSFSSFGMFFDTQLVHNYFCSSLKSPL